MSITPFLSGQQFDHQQFDQESKRVLNVALEMVCLAPRTGDCDEGVKLAILRSYPSLPDLCFGITSDASGVSLQNPMSRT